jgi:hypothetical protein
MQRSPKGAGKHNMLEDINIKGTNPGSSRIAFGTSAIGGWMWGGPIIEVSGWSL